MWVRSGTHAHVCGEATAAVLTPTSNSEICPPDQRGKVTGTYGAIGNFTGFIMPLLIAIITDYA